MVTPAEGPSLGTAPAGTCTWNRLPVKAPGSIPSSLACERTKERAISADSFMTSPSWPVRVRPSVPSMTLASTKSTSPPAPVTARPVDHARDTLVRSAASKKKRGRPSQPRTSGRVDDDGRGRARRTPAWWPPCATAARARARGSGLRPPGCSRPTMARSASSVTSTSSSRRPARSSWRRSRWCRAMVTFSSSV